MTNDFALPMYSQRSSNSREYPCDTIVLPSSIASTKPKRPVVLPIRVATKTFTNRAPFSAYQHIDLSPDSLKHNQMVHTSAVATETTDLQKFFPQNGCIYCGHRSTKQTFHRSVSFSTASDTSVFSFSLVHQFRRTQRKLKQFFEAINPLNGFDGKESLETYLWEQSLKVEPKDAEKLDNIKPSRPPNVLKSPGIKPPKSLSSAGSTSGPSNHYAGYSSSGRAFPTAFNTYSPGMFNEPPNTPRSFVESTSQMDERNSHLGMVEINPGYQPRYLGDARRGEVSPLSLAPITSTMPPPLVPRLRKEKARSGPPSPLSNIISSPSSSKSHNCSSNSPPPPLYPRRTSPHFFPSPVLPPPPFKTPKNSSTAPTSPLSSNYSSAATERAESFVFPPNSSIDGSRTLVAEAGASHASSSIAPAVPPRRKAEALPTPLSPDAVRIVWSGESSPRTAHMTAMLPLSPSSSANTDPPPLYPRRSVVMEPPPRPPKKNIQRRQLSASTNIAYMESNGGESSPPPLPPKTYKRQQRRS